MTKEGGPNINSRQIERIASSQALREDFDKFALHQQSQFENACQLLVERNERVGILGNARIPMREFSEMINQEFLQILNGIREGNNVTYHILKVLNRIHQRPRDTIMGRLDQATDLAQGVLDAVVGRNNILGKPVKPDESIVVVSGLGIYDPYIPTLENLVGSRKSTKALIKGMQKEIDRTEDNAEKFHNFIEKKGKKIQENAKIYDELQSVRNGYANEKTKAVQLQQSVIGAVENGRPISQPLEDLQYQIKEANSYAKGILQSNRRLGRVLEDIALLGSAQAEMSAILSTHRTAVIGVGSEMMIRTMLPFLAADVIANETERAQLLSVHIALQIYKEMNGGEIPDNYLKNGVGAKLLYPEDAKRTIISNIEREALDGH